MGALPLEHGWRRAAGRGAAAELARIERPVLVGRVTVSAYGTRSLGVIGPCGRAAARRSATVGFQLTRFYPSASASLSIVVAARFRHYGWRVWMVLH